MIFSLVAKLVALVALAAKLGSVVLFFIIILTTFVLAFAHWIYLIVLRAWEYMRRELVNPLMPAAAAQAKVYFVPGLPNYQQQLPMYGVGRALPLDPLPGYQSSVKIQEVCRGVLFSSFLCLKNWGKKVFHFYLAKIAFSGKNFKTTITKFRGCLQLLLASLDMRLFVCALRTKMIIRRRHIM